MIILMYNIKYLSIMYNDLLNSKLEITHRNMVIFFFLYAYTRFYN